MQRSNNTRQREDNHSTEFGLWVRKQPELDSRHYGIDGENLDFIWFKYKSAKLMLLEEKRYMSHPSPAQKDTHGILDQALYFACNNSDFYARRFIKVAQEKLAITVIILFNLKILLPMMVIQK